MSVSVAVIGFEAFWVGPFVKVRFGSGRWTGGGFRGIARAYFSKSQSQVCPRSYIQLKAAFRDGAAGPKQRTDATLGRFDAMGEWVRSMHEGLSHILGIESAETLCYGAPDFDSSRALGDVWVRTALRKQLGFDALAKAFRQHSRHRIPLEALLRIMVFNRLCDADSKLGVLR